MKTIHPVTPVRNIHVHDPSRNANCGNPWTEDAFIWGIAWQARVSANPSGGIADTAKVAMWRTRQGAGSAGDGGDEGDDWEHEMHGASLFGVKLTLGIDLASEQVERHYRCFVHENAATPEAWVT